MIFDAAVTASTSGGSLSHANQLNLEYNQKRLDIQIMLNHVHKYKEKQFNAGLRTVKLDKILNVWFR